MQRVYNGPSPEVDVVFPGRDAAVRVQRGGTVEVSGDEAKALDLQGDTWLTPGKAAKTDVPTPKPAEAPKE